MEQERRDEEDAEGAEPYFPPTDPVIAPSERGKVEIIGGFEETSMDSVEVDAAPAAELTGGESATDEARRQLDEIPGDEALADAVRRELREDATTTHLSLDVQVRGSVVFLRGRADDLEDADNAADVASRVPGIREVVEQIAVPEV